MSERDVLDHEEDGGAPEIQKSAQTSAELATVALLLVEYTNSCLTLDELIEAVESVRRFGVAQELLF